MLDLKHLIFVLIILKYFSSPECFSRVQLAFIIECYKNSGQLHLSKQFSLIKPSNNNLTEFGEEYRIACLDCFVLLLCFDYPESAVDRQITFPLSPAHNIEMERNGKPGLDDLNEGMQNMDVEEPQCELH